MKNRDMPKKKEGNRADRKAAEKQNVKKVTDKKK
jgi:hypothetical protein